MVGDALAVFGGIVDPLGTVSYITTNDLVFDITGLDPAKRYTFVHYANRGGAYGWNRAGLATLSDAGPDGFVNSSTVGTDEDGFLVFTDAADPSTRYPADPSGTPVVYTSGRPAMSSDSIGLSRESTDPGSP